MRKIGTTSSGMVLVEMSSEQYDALSKISGSSKPHPLQVSDEATSMSFTEKMAFVKPRIVKLGPKKLDALIRGIETMFNFTGGLDDREANMIVNQLKKEKILTISEGNKVTYRKA